MHYLRNDTGKVKVPKEFAILRLRNNSGAYVLNRRLTADTIFNYQFIWNHQCETRLRRHRDIRISLRRRINKLSRRKPTRSDYYRFSAETEVYASRFRIQRTGVHFLCCIPSRDRNIITKGLRQQLSCVALLLKATLAWLKYTCIVALLQLTQV